jgi:hypothetical protein
MDPKFQSSFIPKGSMPTVNARGVSVDRGERSFFGFLSLIIFIITVLLAGGVFAYKLYLNSEITQMGANLTTASATLDPTTIDQMVDLNARIVSVQSLLAQHVVLSPLFAFIESSTISSVRLTDFNYSVSDKGLLQVVIKGEANGYSDVALQANVLNQTPYLSDIVFSDLTLNPQGQVDFTVSANVDPSLVSYEKEIQGLKVVLPSASSTSATTSPLVVASTTPQTTASTSVATTH